MPYNESMNSPRSSDWHADNPIYASDLRRARELHAQMRESSDQAQNTLLEFTGAAAFLAQKKWRLRMSAAIAISTLDSPQMIEVLQAIDASVKASAWTHSGNPLGSQMLPLTCAVQFAKIDALNFFLTRINPNEISLSGETALATALNCGWQEGARQLAPITDLRSSQIRRPYLETAAINDDAELENWRVSLIENEIARRASLHEARAIGAAVPARPSLPIKKSI